MGDVLAAFGKAWDYTHNLPWKRIGIAFALFLLLGAGLVFVAPHDREPHAETLEMAGDAATFGQALARVGPAIWGDSTPSVAAPPHARCGTYRSELDCSEAVHLARRGLLRDLVFIATYAIWALGLCYLGATHVRRKRKGLLYAAMWATGIAATADLVENWCLAAALHSPESGTWPRAATVAASIKWALVPVFIAGALVGLTAWLRAKEPDPDAPAAARTANATPHQLDRARRWAPPAQGAWTRDQPGVCFSGGGIRSASFCLGVMQQLETGDGKHGSALAKARYLAAVSGGGYIAGAAQLHASLESAGAPFTPSSAEADHLRRHGNYLADSAREWLAAITQALGKLLANLGLVGLLVVAVSQPLGWIGRLLLGAKPEAVTPHGDWPHLPLNLVIALVLLGLPALVLAAARRHAPPTPAGPDDVGPEQREQAKKALRKGRTTSGLAASLAIALGAGAAVLATTVFVLPLLNGLGRQIAGLVGHPEGVTAAGWPSALLAAVLGRVVTKALKRETTGGSAPADPKAERATKKGKPNLFFAKNFAELVAGPVIVLVLLGYITALATLAREYGPIGVVWRFGSVPIRDWQIALVAAALFCAIVVAVDAVNWSMHRFYKRRLWSAFTYDKARSGERDWSITLKISECDKQLPGRPELVLCGAVQVSGPGLAPPGHRAVTWTFDPGWVGGPEIGWCETAKMEAALGARGRGGDISMFGAVAIAGAAFGSAMGRHSMGSLNAVLALSNARLGVWLPNPGQLQAGKWSYRRHDLRYLGREIVGRYSPNDRWVLVADGGHYENLGLVELFRRRCTKIVCIEASGDATGSVTTVAEALRVAELELGVTVTVPAEGLAATEEVASPWDVAPGGGTLVGSTDALADALKSRLARHPTVRATIHYPSEANDPGEPEVTTGTLIVGRAVLDPEAPWPVLSYAVGNESFPNDPTGDQWFDADQFDDYVILGRYLGDCLLSEMATIGWYE